MRNAHTILVGKSEGKRSFGRPRRLWEDNINTDLTDVECEYTDWTHRTQD